MLRNNLDYSWSSFRTALPDDTTIRERIIREVQNYELVDEQRLMRKLGDEKIAYVEPLFRGDFMEQMHTQFAIWFISLLYDV